jgi:hypothetical protein
MSQQVTITAQSMIYAQGYKLDAGTRAILVAKADRYRTLTGETGPTDINVPVRDSHGALIGHLKYML